MDGLRSENGQRRRGEPRPTRYMTDVHFIWRIRAAAQRLQALLDVCERGERHTRTTEDLGHLEQRIEKMLTQAQLELIDQELAAGQEEKTACDG